MWQKCWQKAISLVFQVGDFMRTHIASVSMPDVSLQLSAAQGAPPVDLSFPLRPANVVTVYGPPETQLAANVGAGAGVVEADSGRYYPFVLDKNGFGHFSVATLDISLQQTSIVVNVVGNERNNTGGPVYFGRYRVGEGRLQACAATTYGAADGVSACSTYVMVKPTQTDVGNITKIAAKVNGGAWFANEERRPQLALAELDQGTATFNLVNDTAEIVHLTLALPDSPDGEFVQLKIGFVAFPVLPLEIAPKSARASRQVSDQQVGRTPC